MFVFRRLLEIQFRLNLITLLERLYHHEKLTARYYRAIAAQDMKQFTRANS